MESHFAILYFILIIKFQSVFQTPFRYNEKVNIQKLIETSPQGISDI